MTQAMTQKDEYIVMKSSHLPANGIISIRDAYAGCHQAARVYGSIVIATQDAQVLMKLNPVGLHGRQVGTSQSVG